MLNEAKKKERDNLKFKQGFGEKTGLSESIADIVICVQAFHWMNPEITLKEVNRILKPNGIFAVINADYPPIINKKLEKIYLNIINKAKKKEHEFKEIYLFKKDIKLEDIKFTDGETINAKWVDIDEFIKMFNNGEIVYTVDFNNDDYIRSLELLGL